MTLMPCVHGMYSGGGFGGAWSLISDLNIPKWRPEGDVVVFLGHLRNPCMRRLKSKG